jgi:hypothetical protein
MNMDNSKESAIRVNNHNEQAIRVLQQIKGYDITNLGTLVDDEIALALKVLLKVKSTLQEHYQL